jgi:hypothetical protein
MAQAEQNMNEISMNNEQILLILPFASTSI